MTHFLKNSATSYLNIFCECSEHLLGNLECLEKVLPARKINGVIVSIVPVEVRDGFLQTKEIVHSTHDDVDGGGVACLRT